MKAFYSLNTILAIMMLLISNSAYSIPYIPNGDELLITLDKYSQRSRFEKINFQLQKNSNKPLQLIRILQETIETGKSTSDPRYIGFVSSYVDRYLKTHKTSPYFKILKARILQHDHKFSDALVLLDKIISTNYFLPQANLLRASILQVQAKYNDAKTDCYSLLGKVSHLVTMACIAQVDGLTNNPERNYAVLDKIVTNYNLKNTSELSWAYDILAQLALQTGKLKLAEHNLKLGLKIAPNNSSLLNSYADLLIQNKQFTKVINLLKHKNTDFTVLLRLAIAEKLSSTDSFYKTQFQNQLNKMLATADFTHQREISSFYLYVENDIKKATSFAIKNWVVQKELYDAQLLLNCALRSKDFNIAQPIINWYTNNTIYDTRLKNSIRILQIHQSPVITKLMVQS